ncbi:hypothetical protein [Halorubrum sp. BV1]|nr:hypothetical protein [Halorubrum sp. BV1]
MVLSLMAVSVYALRFRSDATEIRRADHERGENATRRGKRNWKSAEAEI